MQVLDNERGRGDEENAERLAARIFPTEDGDGFYRDCADAAKRLVRWAALLHDIGKPAHQAYRPSRLSLHGHEV
jgi:HD superfamily phosphodiesterase